MSHNKSVSDFGPRVRVRVCSLKFSNLELELDYHIPAVNVESKLVLHALLTIRSYLCFCDRFNISVHCEWAILLQICGTHNLYLSYISNSNQNL